MTPLRVGFLGAGRIAGLHARYYLKEQISAFPSAAIAAVADTDRAAAQALADTAAGADVYTDLAALLHDDAAIDAVEILTPTPLHEEHAIACAEAGKHVHLQKPMANDLASAQRIIDACAHNGVVLKIAENYCHYPPLVAAKQLVDDGAIGAVSQIRMKFVGGGSGGWNVPSDSWEWRASETAAGRPDKTFDHGHHMFATAYWLIGKQLPTHVFGHVAPGSPDCPSACLWRTGKSEAGSVTTTTTTTGTIEWASAPDLAIPSDYYSCDEWFEVTGDKGMLFVNRCSGRVHEGQAAPVRLFTSDGWTELEEAALDARFGASSCDWAAGFVASSANFVDACLGVAEPSISGADGHAILRFSLALQESSRLREEVRLPASDDEAQQVDDGDVLGAIIGTRPKGETSCRPISTSLGEAVGISNKWEEGQYCSIVTGAGLVGCGIYDTDVADEFGFAFALAKGTPDKPLVEPEDLLGANIVKVSARAAEAGIEVNMRGEEALTLLQRAETQRMGVHDVVRRGTPEFAAAAARLEAAGYAVPGAEDFELEKIHCDEGGNFSFVENGFLQAYLEVDGKLCRVLDYAPAQRLQPHHHDIDELFLIRGGSVQVQQWAAGVGEDDARSAAVAPESTTKLAAGDALEVPAGIVHGLVAGRKGVAFHECVSVDSFQKRSTTFVPGLQLE